MVNRKTSAGKVGAATQSKTTTDYDERIDVDTEDGRRRGSRDRTEKVLFDSLREKSRTLRTKNKKRQTGNRSPSTFQMHERSAL